MTSAPGRVRVIIEVCTVRKQRCTSFHVLLGTLLYCLSSSSLLGLFVLVYVHLFDMFYSEKHVVTSTFKVI